MSSTSDRSALNNSAQSNIKCHADIRAMPVNRIFFSMQSKYKRIGHRFLTERKEQASGFSALHNIKRFFSVEFSDDFPERVRILNFSNSFSEALKNRQF